MPLNSRTSPAGNLLARTAQALYRLTLRLELEGGAVSDAVVARFAVRDIRSEVDSVLKGHVFYVNDQRVRPHISCRPSWAACPPCGLSCRPQARRHAWRLVSSAMQEFLSILSIRGCVLSVHTGQHVCFTHHVLCCRGWAMQRQNLAEYVGLVDLLAHGILAGQSARAASRVG